MEIVMSTETVQKVPITILLEQIAAINESAATELKTVLTSKDKSAAEKMLKVQEIAEQRNLTAAVWEAVKQMMEMLKNSAR